MNSSKIVGWGVVVFILAFIATCSLFFAGWSTIKEINDDHRIGKVVSLTKPMYLYIPIPDEINLEGYDGFMIPKDEANEWALIGNRVLVSQDDIFEIVKAFQVKVRGIDPVEIYYIVFSSENYGQVVLTEHDLNEFITH